VDTWTRSCFSISCVLSFLYSQKYFPKVWTGGQALKILIFLSNVIKCGKEVVFIFHVFFLLCNLQNIFKKCGQVDNFSKRIMYFIIIKWELVNKKLSLYFMFSFFLVTSKTFSKSVDRWTNFESSEKKWSYGSLLESVDMWTRSCLSILCFLSFLYPPNYFQKVWTGGQVLKVLKKTIFT